MRKEIAEQADAIKRTLSGRLEPRFQTAHLGGIELAARDLLEIKRIKILGCGSAYIAGAIGAHLIEQLARIPAACRAGVRVPLPQPGDRAGHALYRRQPVRRDVRHARGGAGDQAQGRPGARRHQRRRQHDRARMRARHLSARRAGGRGRVDQDLHLHGGGVRAARDPSRPHPRSVDGRWRAAAGGAGRAARADRQHPRARGRDRGAGGAAGGVRARLFRRPRGRLCGGDGRRAEAQGGELPARRGLSGLGAEARAAGADRAGDADASW